jgi:5,10-methenyltetrahydrofolate synthetase
MQTWGDIRAWRRATRAELLVSRLRVPRGEKERVRAAVRQFIWEQFPELRHACIGFYWPFKGEIDLRHLVRDFLAVGAEASLPVVVEKRQPLEFWAWRPRMKMERGIWNIPVPTSLRRDRDRDGMRALQIPRRALRSQHARRVNGSNVG